MPPPSPGPNDRPLADFAGLSPNQVHQLLQDFLGHGSVVQLAGMESCREDIPLVWYVGDLLDRLREADIKLTPKGNLPTQLVQSWFDAGRLPAAIANPGNAPRMREDASPPAQVAKHLSLILGYAKKRHNVLSLTAKGRKIVEQPAEIFLRELLLGQLRRFNLGWADGFHPSSALQHVFGFLAYLLLRYGERERTAQFYADQIRRAFPVLEEHFPGRKLHDALYIRLLEHFLAHYGMVRLRPTRDSTYGWYVEATDCFRSVFRLRTQEAATPVVRFDARLGGPSYTSADLPEEMLKAFEAQVEQFEQLEADAGEVTVGSLLGDLLLLPPEEILDAPTAHRECQRVVGALAERGIHLDGEAAETLDSPEYYAYLYHELLNHAVAEPTPGAPRTISFAEVRLARLVPTEALMENFLLSLFRLAVPFPVDLLASKVQLGERGLSRQRALDEVLRWRRSWVEVARLAFDPVAGAKPVTNDRKRAAEPFLVGYEVRSASDGEVLTFTGQGVIDFILEDGEWRVAGAAFPGFPR